MSDETGTCPHDGTTRHVTNLPVSDDTAALLEGVAVTTCCGSPVTFFTDDATLCCKCCWVEIPLPA